MLRLLCVVTFLGLTPAVAQMNHGHSSGGHDMTRMPGLQGIDTTDTEVLEMAEMFRRFRSLTRTVEHLPNGVRAETFTDDPELMGHLVSHVTGMVARLEEGRDPKVAIQSPTLAILFAHRDSITTVIEPIAGGLAIVQTSDDPQVVAALQTHADEVSDMAEQGMHAVHMRMMRDRQTH